MNAAGHTKKVVTTSIGFVFSCIGNVSRHVLPFRFSGLLKARSQIVGPQVYLAHESPHYQTGLYVDIGCWCILCIMSFVMAYYLNYLNKQQEKRRIAAGRMENIKDTSIMSLKQANVYKERLKVEMRAKGADVSKLNKNAFEDLTDLQNIDFHFVSVLSSSKRSSCSRDVNISMT